MIGLQKTIPSTTSIIIVYLIGIGIVTLSIFILNDELHYLLTPLQLVLLSLEVSLPTFAINGASVYFYLKDKEDHRRSISRHILMAGVFSVFNFLVPFIFSYILELSLKPELLSVIAISFFCLVLSLLRSAR